ncbi:oligosaccharide flippase family protein [Oceanisphaera pacifica]|uniref:Oligosaccharide flippase family protein n=1 Tax=Oceanisphaera pacifica TaxID=2818389 RepID=A0ABS3NGL4_9GAMM|nr:oligosaccharide flippase family protein [Oceanisphaera pacifica]
MNKFKSGSFIGGAGIYLFSNILNATIPFVLLPILTRYLSPEEYGEVAMFQTLLGALGAFVGMTFVGAAGRKYYDANLDKKELAEFIGSCVQLTIIFSLTVFFIIFLFKDSFSGWLSLKSNYILSAVFVAASLVIVRLRLGQWQVEKKAIKYGTLQISQSIFNMLLSLLLVVVFLKGAEGRINAQIIMSLVFLAVALILLKKDNLLKVFSLRKDYLTEALRFGVPLIPHVAGAFLLISVDRFIIGKKIGLTEVGVYMVAVQLVSIMSLIFDAINKAYVPHLYEVLKRNDFYEKRKIIIFTYLWFIFILLGVGLVFIIGPWFVVFFAGEKYAQAGDVIGLLALGQGFRGMYLTVTNFIFYSKRTSVLSTITMGTGVLNVFLLIVLIKFFGLVGAAVAYSLSMALFFFLTWWYSTQLVSMPWSLR